jgi:subtilisin family serine protease
LEVRLKSSGPAITPVDWIQLGYPITEIKLPDGSIVGHIEHLRGTTGNNANKIYINLRATDAAARDGNNAPAPDGTWTVELRNPSNADVIFHAWIYRDDAGHPASSRLRQSRFHVDDAKPGHTVTGWACGSKTISVGAYNAATDEVSQYSACGPARPIGAGVARAKPDIYAPAEQTVRASGILSASSLSARSTRMNGTSAAAPHVTGLIALIFEYAGKTGPNARGAQRAVPASDRIRDALVKCAGRGSLKPNRYQLVNDRVPVKQDDVWPALVSSGKADLLATLNELFP